MEEKKKMINKLSHILELREKKETECVESSILLDDELRRMRDYFSSISLDSFRDRTKADKEDVIKYDKKFFKENIPLQKIIAYGEKDIPYKTNPFNILKFKKHLKTSYVDYSKIMSGKYRGRIAFEPIIIKDTITKLSYGGIGHEIVHTQIEKNPNLLTNYYNREVLSIFVEMIISNSLDDKTLDNIMRYRFQNVYECIVDLSYYGDVIFTSDKIFQFRCYLSSSLKALHLYDIYINSNREKRVEILSLVEDVFRDKITVEDFLYIMHVTYDNSKDVELVKHYVKKY